MNRIKDEAGLTLVELLITITIMGIISVVIVGASYVAFRSYSSSNTSTREMQRARLAMEYIVRELRVAKSATIGANAVTYQSWADDTNRTISLGSDQYLYLNNGITTRPITRAAIKEFNCSFESSDAKSRIMRIEIVVSDLTSLSSSVTMLNKE